MGSLNTNFKRYVLNNPVEYGVNIIDHAILPLKESIVVIRQLTCWRMKRILTALPIRCREKGWGVSRLLKTCHPYLHT